jgi:hypothetical protein
MFNKKAVEQSKSISPELAEKKDWLAKNWRLKGTEAFTAKAEEFNAEVRALGLTTLVVSV